MRCMPGQLDLLHSSPLSALIHTDTKSSKRSFWQFPVEIISKNNVLIF